MERNYSSFEDQQIDLTKFQPKPKVKDITELSTPNEMANFITEKLMEFIEQELGSSKKAVSATRLISPSETPFFKEVSSKTLTK